MTEQYYHNLITQKSFELLKRMRQRYNFILIGGWAVFLYTHNLKSKDIDIIVDFETLAKIKKDFALFKNERLKKYEIKLEEIDIDIYVPYFSDLGLPIQEIQSRTVGLEGFQLPYLTVLLILKQIAWLNRKDSVKGEKDKIDIIGLLLQKIDWTDYRNLLTKVATQDNLPKKLKELLQQTVRVSELGLNNQKMARLRKKILVELG